MRRNNAVEPSEAVPAPMVLPLLLDENKCRRLGTLLATHPSGLFDVCHVYEPHVGLRGRSDTEVTIYAFVNGRTLLSEDVGIVDAIRRGVAAPMPMILVAQEHPLDTVDKLLASRHLWQTGLTRGAVLDLRRQTRLYCVVSPPRQRRGTVAQPPRPIVIRCADRWPHSAMRPGALSSSAPQAVVSRSAARVVPSR